MSVKKIGLCFSVSSASSYTVVPEEKPVANAFDFVGGMLSTPRIDGERNVAYRNRLFDVAVHPATPGYQGIINGLTRDFGYTREKTLLIDLKTDSAGDNLAENPRVDILANKVALYGDWMSPQSYTLDKEIYFYEPGSAGHYLQGLVNEINSSTYFTASMYAGARTNMHSTILVRGTSSLFVQEDLVRADYMTYFTFGNILQGTLWFEEKDIFVTEVTTTPVNDGEYYVDYTNGWVRSAKLPSGEGRAGYRAASFPLKVDSSPIQIFELHDDDFKEELYYQETLDSGDEVNGLPAGEGSEILHQLYTGTKVFWGQ